MEETGQTNGVPSRKVNCFVRGLIVAFSLLLVVMITYNYFFVEPKGEISSGLITLLLILLVIILSESFDQMSIGKLVSLSRNIRKKEERAKSLEKEKAKLLEQLITVTTSQSQSQQHISVSGDLVAPGTPSTVSSVKADDNNAMGFTPDVTSVAPNRVNE